MLICHLQGEYGWTGKQFKTREVCFHREPANIGKIRDDFFLIRTIPLGWMGWGCSPLMFEGSGWVSFRLAYY